MKNEVPIGPNPCWSCGGEYGEHASDCETRNKQPTVLIESMTKLHCRGWTFRIWRESEFSKWVDSNAEVAKRLHEADARYTDVSQIAVYMLNMDNVNAVEFLDPLGSGVVLYKDWP